MIDKCKSIFFDNRNSTLVIKGSIDNYYVVEADDKRREHLCLSLNTGFNVLIEIDKLLQILESVKIMSGVYDDDRG